MTTTAYIWGPSTKNIFNQQRKETPEAGAQPARFQIYGTSISPPQGTWGMAYVTASELKLAIHGTGGALTDSGADNNCIKISIDGGDFISPDDFDATDSAHATLTWDLGTDTTHLIAFRTYLYGDLAVFDEGDTFLWLTGATPALQVAKDWAYPGDAAKCISDTPLNGPAPVNIYPVYGPVYDYSVGENSSNPMGMAVRADWIECWVSSTDDAVMISVDGAAPVIIGSIGFPVGDQPPNTNPGKTAWKLDITPGVHDIFATCAVEGSLLAIGGKFNGDMTPPPYVRRMTHFGDSITSGTGTRAGMTDGTIIPPRLGRIGSPAGIDGLSIETYRDRIDGILHFRSAAGADDVAVIALGHNDGNNWSTEKGNDYQYMVDALFAKGYGRIIARGVFPDDIGSPSDWTVVNAGIAALVATNVAAGKAIEFEDTTTWLNISMITPHPGWVGYNQIADLAAPWLRDNDYARNKPSILSLAAPGATVLNADTALVPSLDFPAWDDTDITIADGHSGVFLPPIATISAGDFSTSVSYRALITGSLVLSASADDPSISPISKAIVVVPQALSLAAPDAIVQYVASANLTASINGLPVTPITVTPSDGGAGGAFTPASVVLDATHLSATFTYTATKVGAITFSLANTGGVTNPTPIVRTATALAPIDGDGTLASWPAELTAVVPLDPTGDALVTIPFDPGDKARIKVDLTARSLGRTIETIETVDFDANSKDLGWHVGIVDQRAILDKTNHAAAVRVYCDPDDQQNASFAGSGVTVVPTIRVRYTNGDTMECSFPFVARQL
jgi:hypothetical protein